MKKDIEIPIAKDVYVVAVHELNSESLTKDWTTYIINDHITAIDLVMVVTNGFDEERKTSTMRHSLGFIEGKSFKKIELLQNDVLSLNNEFFVTYYAGNKFYEKRFLFAKNCISENMLNVVPVMKKTGVLAK